MLSPILRRRVSLLGLGLFYPGVRRDWKRKARQWTRRDERVAAGLCRDCGKEPLEGCHTRCRGCLEKHRFARSDRRSLGLCYDCGSPPETGKTRCFACCQRVNACSKAKYSKARKCLGCGNQPEGRKLRCGPCDRARRLAKTQARLNSTRRIRANLKAQVYAAYGGRCAHCGSANPHHLNIDHVHNDGGQDRFPSGKRILSTPLYRRIIAMGFPPDYQILCRNCNYAKYLNGGTLEAR